MSAIGTSPCPPFANRAGLPPGVLWDGNTVAWYKYNDPVAGVCKDGANRVCAWFDKFNYVISAELVDQATWYNVGWWTAWGANWSTVGTTMVANGAAGNAQRNATFVVGESYEMNISLINLGVGGWQIDDGIGSILINPATGTYKIIFAALGTSLFFRSTTFNGSVTAFSIKRISGKTLLQRTAASQPLAQATGILFDGLNDFMKATAFAFVQPEFIYFVGKQVTHTANDFIHDGNLIDTMGIVQIAPSPNIFQDAGLFGVTNTNFTLNVFKIIRQLYSGVNSFIRVNKTAAIVGNAGANNAGGFTLGAPGNFAAQFANIEVKEIILRKSADSAAVQSDIYNYLQNANGII